MTQSEWQGKSVKLATQLTGPCTTVAALATDRALMLLKALK
jgi:hypothetical protein